MTPKSIITTLLLALTLSAEAQDIDSVLNLIERNNTTLQALAKSNEADKEGLRSVNNLRETTINYSPFFAKGTSGVASSEFIVSQDFDFPTLYSARTKAARLQSESLDLAYQAQRNDILLQAQLLCIDIIHNRKLTALMQTRLHSAQTLNQLCTKKYDDGSATILELNKTRMELMKAESDISQYAADQLTLHTRLQALNGDQPLQFSGTAYPALQPLPSDTVIMAHYTALSPELQAARAQTATSEQNISVSRQGALPKLSVGYRRNTEMSSARNGFLVGASIPLFANRHKVRQAKIHHESQLLQFQDAQLQAETRLRTMLQDIRLTRQSMQAYDLPLMQSSLQLLGKAVQEGQLTIIDYFREYNDIISRITERLELERKYRQLVAQALRYQL